MASAEVLTVGPGRRFTLPSQAAKSAKDGDFIEIDASVFVGDVAVWTASNLTIRGVGGRPHLKAYGAHAQGKGIWVIQGKNTTVENIEFSGARVPDKNGAGIRQDGVGLTVRNCYFHENENGILGGGGDGEVIIEYSEFASNGHGDGYSHNIYINRVKSFTLRGSYSHHTRVGHNVKSRARTNYILYNRIMDEANGTSSYAIDLPNGGVSYAIGNLIQQGPLTENSTIISYGAEGVKHAANELYVVNNTIVNDRPQGGRFLFVAPPANPVRIVNNLFVGKGTLLSGPGELTHNLSFNGQGFLERVLRLLGRRDASPTPSQAGFVDPANYDYRLIRSSPAVDAGFEPGTANGFSLRPDFHYVHKARLEPRGVVGTIDIGAYEYQPIDGR